MSENKTFTFTYEGFAREALHAPIFRTPSKARDLANVLNASAERAEKEKK